MRTVPRESFLPDRLRSDTYLDMPLSIGYGQTISAPHMVAIMCEYLKLEVGDKVLEVGAGSGYHAAVIAEIISPKHSEKLGHVYTVEIIKELADFARSNLEKTSYGKHVTVVHGDGCLGLQEYAPFNKILVTAAAPRIPESLIEQLAYGGILLSPVGEPYFYQKLVQVIKDPKGGLKKTELGGVAFVPLRGKYGWKN